MSVFLNEKLDSDNTLYFCGIVVRSNELDIKRIKDFISELKNTKLIYQHTDIGYLVVLRGEQASKHLDKIHKKGGKNF